MSEDDPLTDIEDLRLRLIAQNNLLIVALAELAETSPVVRACLEDILWQAEVGQMHFGPQATEVNKVLPRIYDIMQGILGDVSNRTSKPLTARRHVPK